ncbi:histone-lysine N-methyltransferase SETMAR-like, partial [Sitodiplosis mosellana]|uniref:histone-lysine N-methyltransferase SETMAR-like n=1 Tax=Sitodiplosis mosellana TaxID=263140 RepID=UPI002443C2CC
RAVIKFFCLENMSGKDIKARLDATLGDSAPSKTTVYSWVNEFARGRTSCEDEHRSGRPNELTTPENIKKVYKMVKDDRRLKVREIAEALHISTSVVFKILHEHLEMHKLSARWVPHLLSPLQKHDRMDISEQCLAIFRANPDEFLRRFITTDETWVHHYTPETKNQSKQWVKKGESAPKKAKTVLSAGKIMATVFWDAHGVIFIDYLERGKTITGPYYATLLDRLDDEIKVKRPHLQKKKVLFHRDNASSHKSAVAMAKIHELRYEVLPHPAYSPDLAPCDFHLFPNLKKWLGGKRFNDDDEVIVAVNGYFGGLDADHYKTGILALEHRWEKCIASGGDYVEK